jgi:hypothetical protein
MITIYDNFLKPDEVRNIYDFLNMDDFVWNKIDDYRGQKVKRMSFGRTIRQPAIGEIMHDDPLVNLYKVSINCIKPFEHFEYHTDEWGSTVIFYVNPVWKWYWGSGTKFRRGGIVRPKPGRAVVFNGRIQHKIIPPTPLMNDFGRLSIAFQYNP